MFNKLIRGAALAGCCVAMAFAPAGGQNRAPAINHVFVIVLENEDFARTFGPGSPAPYLADSLPSQGAFLRQYYGIGHSSLDNYIAMISGIAPTPQTQGDCGRYDDFVQTGMAPDGQPIGKGCVYPAHVRTIANQLSASGRTWKGYMEDMGRDPSRETATCAHPPIGELDPTERATAADQYAGKHNPFMYFHAVIDHASCRTQVVPLTELEADLASKRRTPNYSFIAPSLCHDGHDRPCRNGEPGGLVSANNFLAHWIPLIMGSAAYRDGGLIIVTFDESAGADATACCSEQSGPNTRSPGTHGPGGGRTGAVLLSPFIKGGTVSDVPYNHYSMLRSVENSFHLRHLGYAGASGLVAFGSDIFTNARASR
ncbi:MAG: alkaline phosphatase family protein [Gemmatimonadota bacterium]|nr:alkaline phosphatase family protein [Gemmatimonadota bacterium]